MSTKAGQLQAVEIWVVHEGIEHEPDGDNQRVDPGAEHEFGLAGVSEPDEAQELLCTDGDIIARADDGTEIRMPPPVCGGYNLRLSDHGPRP